MGVADSEYAELTRKDWESYQTDFFPWEDKAVDFAMSEGTVDKALEKAEAGISRGHDNAVKSFDMDLAKYGVSETARESTTRKRQNNLSKTASVVSGLNKTRAHVQDLQQKVMAGDMAAGLSGSRLTEQ